MVRIWCGTAENAKKNPKKKFLSKIFLKKLRNFFLENFFNFFFLRNFFFGFFFEFFFEYSAVPHQIRTTGQKIIKIHQLEQILGKCPYAGSLWRGG